MKRPRRSLIAIVYGSYLDFANCIGPHPLILSLVFSFLSAQWKHYLGSVSNTLSVTTGILSSSFSVDIKKNTWRRILYINKSDLLGHKFFKTHRDQEHGVSIQFALQG